MDKLYVGIDTSNYTTSAALCTETGEVVANIKKLLSVEQGERGLRQSDALFQHTKNLPEIMEALSRTLKENYPQSEICAIGYSAYPRDCEGSYMPCFLAGRSAAHSMAAGIGCPIYKFSHQAGHISAALYSSGAEACILSKAKACGGRFAAFHVSGGTTELLLVTLADGDMKIEQIGGTRDINAGQAIDRAGVMMGLNFPCGREMETFCSDGKAYTKQIKICVDGLYCNLSGLENQSAQIYERGHDRAEVCEFVFDFVGKTLLEMTENLRCLYPDIPVIYAGGVMSNNRIKKMLSQNDRVYFARPEFSSDNAAGTALLCRRAHIKNK